MSALEDRLRRELRAESEQITSDSIAAWSLPSHTGRGRRLLSPAYGGGERQGAPARGWLTCAAAAIVVAAAIAGSVALSHALFRAKAPGGPPPASMGGISRAAAAARHDAVDWIAAQVNREAVVSCDAQMCADLARKGFPSGNLEVLGPTTGDPLGSSLVIATAAVRARYGTRLASVYAPAIVASFGSGNARIDIRLLFPGGGAGYRTAQQLAARARKTADAALLANSRIAFSATARAQLRSGRIDPRLPQLIAIMAHSHPVRIVDFGDHAPGGGPADLLRSVDLAAADPAAHLTPAAYRNVISRLAQVQRAEFRPSLTQVTLPTGQAVLRLRYSAPSPLR